MTSDSLWPVYKGASFNLWNPDTGRYFAWADPIAITDHLQQKRTRQARRRDNAFYGTSPDQIADPATLPCRRPRVAFRDIARATDPRTVITALIPPEVVITNKGPYLLQIAGTAADEAFVLGVLSSMILDWYARRVVELNMNFHILNSFPVPDSSPASDPVAARVAEIAGRLAAVDDRFSEWAAAVGVPVGSANDEPTKSELIYELDACVARLYGLDETDLEVIYTTFRHGVDYSDRYQAVLAHFRRLAALSDDSVAPDEL